MPAPSYTELIVFLQDRLLRTWLRLKCIGMNTNNRLIRLTGETCDDVEAVLDIVFPSGRTARFLRADVNDDTIAQLTTMHPSQIWTQEQRHEWIYTIPLYARDPKNSVTYMPTPDAHFLGDTDETHDTWVVMRDGYRVARAWSIRRNDEAAEVAVETLESYRRRGFARQVEAAWARHQHANNRIAIHAHRPNDQSQALAQSVGGELLVEVLSYF